MNESVATDTSKGRTLNAQAYGAPGVGVISWIDQGVRRLVRSEPHRSGADGAVETGSERVASDAAHRSAMDAGITGGLSMLGGSNGWGGRG